MKFNDLKIKQLETKHKIQTLSVCENYDYTPEDGYVTLTFVPNKNEMFCHYYIDLKLKQALQLRNWLDTYLKKHGAY